MKNLHLLIVGMFFLVATSYGQGSLGKSDPAAKKILDDVSAKFKSFKGVQSSFTLKVEDGKGKVQGSEKGTVYMKGPKYRVDMGEEISFAMGKTYGLMKKPLMR